MKLRGPEPSEHLIQSGLIGVLAYRLRSQVVRFSIPNGGLRNARVAAQLNDEGVCPGFPDLGFCYEEGRSLFLEMKTRGGSLSDYQKGVRYKLEQLGHQWFMARSVDEAMEILAAKGLLK